MVVVRNVLVSTYGWSERDLRKLNVARKKIAHDRLVLICDSGDEHLPVIRENMEERGGEFVHVEVDPLDFVSCLDACFRTVDNMNGKNVKVNISCGPKTLVGAMLFSAFHAGVEVFHCDVVKGTGEEIMIRLPTLSNFELRKRFPEEDWRIVRLLTRERQRKYIAKRAGAGNTTLERALSRLEREGLLEVVLRDGKVWVVPTAIGSFYADLAPKPRN
jgi:hypothetical protein